MSTRGKKRSEPCPSRASRCSALGLRPYKWLPLCSFGRPTGLQIPCLGHRRRADFAGRPQHTGDTSAQNAAPCRYSAHGQWGCVFTASGHRCASSSEIACCIISAGFAEPCNAGESSGEIPQHFSIVSISCSMATAPTFSASVARLLGGRR